MTPIDSIINYYESKAQEAIDKAKELTPGESNYAWQGGRAEAFVEAAKFLRNLQALFN